MLRRLFASIWVHLIWHWNISNRVISSWACFAFQWVRLNLSSFRTQARLRLNWSLFILVLQNRWFRFRDKLLRLLLRRSCLFSGWLGFCSVTFAWLGLGWIFVGLSVWLFFCFNRRVYFLSISLLPFIRSIVLQPQNFRGDRSTTNLIVELIGWVWHSRSSCLMTRFGRHHEFRRAGFRIHICRFPWWAFGCGSGSKFSLDRSWLLRLVDLAIVIHGHFRGSRAIYTICESGIPPIIQRHLPILELVQQVVVCAVRALFIVHCVCSHDLLDISLPLHLTLLLLCIEVLFRLYIVI